MSVRRGQGTNPSGEELSMVARIGSELISNLVVFSRNDIMTTLGKCLKIEERPESWKMRDLVPSRQALVPQTKWCILVSVLPQTCMQTNYIFKVSYGFGWEEIRIHTATLAAKQYQR